MPTSSSAVRTTACASAPGALPADRAACCPPACTRNRRSAMTERPLFATHTKSTFMTLGRERASNREPFAHGARCLDGSSGGGDDVLHDRETESRAARTSCRVGAVEALEDACAVVGPEPHAVVGDGERRRVVGMRQGDATRAALTGVADRIRDEVLSDDADHARPERQLDLVSADELQRDLGVLCAAGERRDDLAQDRESLRPAERYHLPSALELPEEEDVVDELSSLLDLLPGLLEEGLDLGPRKRRGLEEREYPGERRPQLVRDGSGEPRPELLVRREFGQVADEEDERAAGVVAEPAARRRAADCRKRRRARRDEPALAVEYDDRLVDAVEERAHPLFVVHHPFTSHSPSSDPSQPLRNR